MIHRISILIVLAYLTIAILWDFAMDALGVQHESFCDACVYWNAWSNGLFALLLPGLWIHIFGQQWLPGSWRGE